MSVSHIGSRNCIRCGKSLVDAASLNEGTGPICRAMDNAVLAVLIPADHAKAVAAFESLNLESLIASLPEIANTLTYIGAALTTGGADMRATVKRIEWLLSFPAVKDAAFETMLTVVRALGYLGLANLWLGEVVKSLATIRCENGRLYLKGANNKGARAALKAIQGRTFHGATKEWSVPAAQAMAFAAVVAAHYPLNSGLKEALNAAQTTPVTPVAPEAVVAEHRIVVNGKTAQVYTPYNSGYIWGLKEALAYGDRKWDGAAKCWVVSVECIPEVKGLIQKYYGKEAQVVGEVPAPVPAPVVAPVAPLSAKVAAELASLPF